MKEPKNKERKLREAAENMLKGHINETREREERDRGKTAELCLAQRKR